MIGAAKEDTRSLDSSSYNCIIAITAAITTVIITSTSELLDSKKPSDSDRTAITATTVRMAATRTNNSLPKCGHGINVENNGLPCNETIQLQVLGI